MIERQHRLASRPWTEMPAFRHVDELLVLAVLVVHVQVGLQLIDADFLGGR
jgi:hypothetical protein